MQLLAILPLSRTVLLVQTPQGWRLSDGHRFSVPYVSAEAAMDDQATRRRLQFGEELPNQERSVPA